MIMVPPENLSKQQHHHHHHLAYYDGRVGSYSDSAGLMSRIQEGYDYNSNTSDHQACLGISDLVFVAANNNNNNHMADQEDESRTNSSLNEAGSSTSKENNQEDRDHDEGSWLQLSIGSHSHSHPTKTSHGLNHHHDHEVDPTARRGGLIELDLLPSGAGGSQQESPPLPLGASTAFYRNTKQSLFFQQQQQQEQGSSSSSMFPHQQEINWAFRPIPQNIAMASASPSSSSLMPFGSYFARPLFHQVPTGLDVAGPSSDFRIIDPPRRPHSGIWFMLLASQNQGKEPFLPQIPKSYLRIKDGGMTVRLLIKYLVNKLKLDSESEIEITCRGQKLQHFWTLQHVRDNIWNPRDSVTLLAETSSTDHLMVLHYARTASI